MLKPRIREDNFEKISKKIEKVNKEIESLIPQTIIREVSAFGNSSHIVLSKELLNKKVGVIVLGEGKNAKNKEYG